MEDTLKLILKKLDNIETRLNIVEEKGQVAQKQKPATESAYEKAVRLVQTMKEGEEISAAELQKKLGIDLKKAEEILDKLASAGYGETYTREA